MCVKASRHLFISLFLSVFLFSACKPSTQDAEDYYDKVLDIQQEVLDKEDVFLGLINQETTDTIDEQGTANTSMETNATDQINAETAYTGFCIQIDTALKQAKALQAFDGKNSLQKALIDLLNEYKLFSGKEFHELYRIAIKDPILRTPEEFKHYGALICRIDSCLDNKINEFGIACKDFARENHFELYEPEK
jgi:hypothetical protein